MCGIAGVIDAAASPPEGAILDRLAAALAHRGPDGQGRHLDGGVGMVQTRLAIIDLETGDQPLYAPAPGGGRTALVANAEIYNYVELRAAMTD
jgi:asparagine synthase (glutamine-hydrolysing)